MASPSIKLIESLRAAAQQLRDGAHYAWGHHGACNCGHLLQVITRLTENEILNYAHTAVGEWSELGDSYCDSSKSPVGLLITKLQDAGLTSTDIHHIENLSDKRILQELPGGFRWLRKNVRQHVILYFEAFANMLEKKLPKPLFPHPDEIQLINATESWPMTVLEMA